MNATIPSHLPPAPAGKKWTRAIDLAVGDVLDRIHNDEVGLITLRVISVDVKPNTVYITLHASCALGSETQRIRPRHDDYFTVIEATA